MKTFGWKPEKNETLKEMGRPSFENVLSAIENGGFREVLKNKARSDQFLMVVMINDYTHAVPFKLKGDLFFLFTVYPSRALHKKYGGSND